MPAKKIRVIINKRVAKGITREVAKAGIEGALAQARNEMDDILTVPPARTGIQYGDPSRFNRSSAPGEAPAPQEGQLRNRIVTYSEEFGDTTRGVIGTNLDYAAHLEFGTERMRPRPFLSRLNEEKRWSRILKSFRLSVKRQYARARGALK